MMVALLSSLREAEAGSQKGSGELQRGPSSSNQDSETRARRSQGRGHDMDEGQRRDGEQDGMRWVRGPGDRRQTWLPAKCLSRATQG